MRLHFKCFPCESVRSWRTANSSLKLLQSPARHLTTKKRHADKNWNVQSETERLLKTTKHVSLSGVCRLLASSEFTQF